MKKSLVIILAVAIIGGLGAYTKSHNSSASASTQTPTVNASTIASNNSSTPASSSSSSGTYKDGTFTGKNVSTEYGDVQLAAVISGGRIVDIKLLEMPNGRGHTQEVTDVSAPLLKQSAISKQSANIDFVSGATSTSQAYETSLQSALDQAM